MDEKYIYDLLQGSEEEVAQTLYAANRLYHAVCENDTETFRRMLSNLESSFVELESDDKSPQREAWKLMAEWAYLADYHIREYGGFTPDMLYGYAKKEERGPAMQMLCQVFESRNIKVIGDVFDYAGVFSYN